MPFAISDVVTRRLVLMGDEINAITTLNERNAAIQANQRLAQLVAAIEKTTGRQVWLAAAVAPTGR